MKIVIDNAIPYIKGVFEPFAEVVYAAAGAITPAIVKDADALIIRTRTHCNKALLEGSKVQHIATATIGFDHIDLDYCRAQNISVTTAAGCNARAVLQWVGAVLAHLSRSQGWSPSERTLGVVGVGNVGSLVARYAAIWGFRVICCDPPRAEREGFASTPFEQLICEADIITMHTPLDSTTRHMIDADSIAKLKPNAVILNASRGEVVDSLAIEDAQIAHRCVFDVWENEPNLSQYILQNSILATPHIAGYSKQGKANATMIAVGQIAAKFGLPLEGWRPEVVVPEPRDIRWEELLQTTDSHYDIVSESNYLKAHVELFEQLRNGYDYREEYF